MRVKNIACGLCGTDISFFKATTGTNSAFEPIPGSKRTYLGHENVGVVTEVGSEVKDFKVVRQADRRDALLTWKADDGCQGYNIRWGIAPDKLYNSWLVYGKSEHLLKSLSTDQAYYFTIEAFNENGVSEPAKIHEIR